MKEEDPGLAWCGLESREKSGQFAGFCYEQWVDGSAVTETMKTERQTYLERKSSVSFQTCEI